jgi:hypothetical protein
MILPLLTQKPEKAAEPAASKPKAVAVRHCRDRRLPS